MIMIKKFENWGEYYRKESTYDWRKEFFQIRELFYNIEENIDDYGGSLDFSAGYATPVGSESYPCYLKNDKIEGDEDNIDHSCGAFGYFCVRVVIDPKLKSPTPILTGYSLSFSGENASKILDIVMRLNYIKKEMEQYELDIVFKRDEIVVKFKRKSR